MQAGRRLVDPRNVAGSSATFLRFIRIRASVLSYNPNLILAEESKQCGIVPMSIEMRCYGLVSFTTTYSVKIDGESRAHIKGVYREHKSSNVEQKR